MYNKGSDLFSRIIFTLTVLLVFRFGSFIPVPGIDALAMSNFANQNSAGMLGMFNMLSGGSLGRMSMFALAIMPYITASIIIQLSTAIYKPLDEMKKSGAAGRKKLNQLSRMLTVIFAALQSYGVSIGLENVATPYGPIVIISPILFRITTVITLVVGTIFLMWLGEQITAKGIGNGVSLIIFTGIVSGLPSATINIFTLLKKGAMSPIVFLSILLAIILVIAFIVLVERAQRRVMIQYPKRQVGNKIYGGDSSYMPLKINTAGVIPPIFASSILLFPATINGFSNGSSDIFLTITQHLSHGRLAYIICYVALIMFFSFFYTAIVFNSEETSENLKKNGAYVPGRRPGKNTAEYFDYLLTRLTMLGGVYLSLICVLPEIFMNKYSISLALGGTSFLIVVNVVLDSFAQIQNHLFSSKYASMMKKMKIK